MEYQEQADNEPDFVLDNRKAVMIFFGFLVICGCFFIIGYVLGSGKTVELPFANNANTGAVESAARRDTSGSEAYNRMNEIVSEPASRPSAAVEPAPAAAKSAVSGAVGIDAETFPDFSDIALDTDTLAVSATAVSTDILIPQPKEIPNKVAAVAEKPAATAKPAVAAKPAASAKPSYSVQVAAFRARRDAEIKAKELEDKGFSPRIEMPYTDGDYYRLKVGNFATRAEAGDMATQLRRSGFETMISENKGN